MEQKVEEVLRRNFAGSSLVTLKDSPGNERYYGHLLWDGFAGQSFLRRQNKVVRVLKRELGPEMNEILHIFTYTPYEYEQMTSMDQAAA